jgi:serine/threonine-protein kinase
MQRPIPASVAGGRQQESRQSWVWAALAGLGVLVVIVLGVALALNKKDNGGNQPPATAQAQLPDLTGLTSAQAEQRLSQLGFTNVSATEPKQDKDCKGEVSGQTPTKGTTVPVDTAVTYTICNAPDKVTVPTGLVGGTRASAEAALKGADLVPVFKDVNSAEPKGQVVKVEQEGQSVSPGTNITVSISNNQLVVVPDVVGKSQETATALLQVAELNVQVKIVPDGGEPGTVVAQSLKPKSKVKSGTDVTISVVGDEVPNPSDSASPDPTGTSGNGGGLGTIE